VGAALSIERRSTVGRDQRVGGMAGAAVLAVILSAGIAAQARGPTGLADDTQPAQFFLAQK
jgi:hypothetical protein